LEPTFFTTAYYNKDNVCNALQHVFHVYRIIVAMNAKMDGYYGKVFVIIYVQIQLFQIKMGINIAKAVNILA
jgi:hypothetical protein